MTSLFGSGARDADLDLVAVLMQECDDMEAALAEWLTRVGRRFATSPVAHNPVNCGGIALDPQLWRTLVIIWLSSPLAKIDFTPEALSGMRCAVDTMNDRMLVSLIACILNEHCSVTYMPAA